MNDIGGEISRWHDFNSCSSTRQWVSTSNGVQTSHVCRGSPRINRWSITIHAILAAPMTSKRREMEPSLCGISVRSVSQSNRSWTNLEIFDQYPERRCSLASTWDGCQLCQALSIPCTLRRGPSRLNVAIFSPKDATHDVRRIEGNSLVAFGSRELLLEFVPLYFQYVHRIAPTIFHEPSFIRQGTLDARLCDVRARC